MALAGPPLRYENELPPEGYFHPTFQERREAIVWWRPGEPGMAQFSLPHKRRLLV